MKYWDQLPARLEFKTPMVELSKKEILEFASEFDPQPYHLDESAADESIFGGLCASGWQVSAIAVRQLSDTLSDEKIPLLGIKSTPSLTWRRPVFSGDKLNCDIVLTDPTSAIEEPSVGNIRCIIEMLNQDQKVVMNMINTLLIARAPK